MKKVADSKKRFQVNVALNNYEYMLIKTIAEKTRRSVADVARLILIDNAEIIVKSYATIKPAKFTPDEFNDLIKNK